MKKIIILSMFFPLAICCQEAHKKYIGFTFSPDYWQRSAKSNAAGNSYNVVQGTTLIQQFSFRTGLAYVYDVNRKVTLEAALLYANRGEHTGKFTLTPLAPDPSIPRQVTATWHD